MELQVLLRTTSTVQLYAANPPIILSPTLLGLGLPAPLPYHGSHLAFIQDGSSHPPPRPPPCSSSTPRRDGLHRRRLRRVGHRPQLPHLVAEVQLHRRRHPRVQLREGAAQRVPGDAGRVPDVRAAGEPVDARVGDGPRPRQPHRAGGLLLPLQRRRPLPRGHEVLHRGGRATPSAPAAADPAGPAAPTTAAAELGLRAVDFTAARVGGGGADSSPRGDRPARSHLIVVGRYGGYQYFL